MKHIKLFEQFVNEELTWSGASSTKHSKEQNEALFGAISDGGKGAEFNEFTTAIQQFDNSAFQTTMDILHNLDSKKLSVFIDGLGKYASVEKLTPSYNKEKSGPMVDLFYVSNDGSIDGLVWMAWLVAGAKPSTDKNFNLSVGAKKYTVLDYSNDRSPLSLGKTVQPTYQLKFVKEMEVVAGVIEEIAQMQSLKSQNPPLYKAAVTASQMAYSSPSMDFSNGTVTDALFTNCVQFVEIANGSLSTVPNDTTTNLILSKSEYIKNGVTSLIRGINDEITGIERKLVGTLAVYRGDGLNVTNKLGRVTGKTAADVQKQYGLVNPNSVFAIQELEFRVREA
jgi:hypothetical protein